MATPHVAGAWAIMKQADPLASVDAVLNRLRKTGKRIEDPQAGIARRLIRLEHATAVTAIDAQHAVKVRNLRKKRTLRPDDVVPVRWRATPGVAEFDLSVTFDGGLTWTVLETGIAATRKKTTWVVPRVAERSDRVKVRVQGFDSAGEKVTTDRNGAWLRFRP
jgi:hypothetical protein